MSLLNTDLTEYYITHKYWDFGGGFIYDKNWNKVSKIHNKLFSVNRRFEIRDMNKQLLVTIQKRIITWHKAQDIKDGLEGSIGTVIRKKIPFRSPTFLFKSDKGHDPYIAIGTSFQDSFEIVDSSSRTIAHVHRLNFSKSNVINSNSRNGEYFVLKLAIGNVDRLELISMVISIENIVYTTFLLSDVAGYGRLIMRLRPFGPGIKEKHLK